MKTLSILYQDRHLVAVNKPSGLLVHRSMIDRHETENAMRILRNQLGQWVWPLHRLDKPTSGVLLFALDKETARLMTQSFSHGKASKHYLAIVRGFTKELECIDYPLKDLWDKMTDQKAKKDKPEKASITEYRRLATVELPYPVSRYSSARYSLIKVAPLTGRNRQIRRHMKHIFHPVVGDTTYGDGKQNAFFRQKFNCCRLLLHAIKVEFIHPFSEQRIHIQAPLDQTFGSLLEALQWGNVGLS